MDHLFFNLYFKLKIQMLRESVIWGAPCLDPHGQWPHLDSPFRPCQAALNILKLLSELDQQSTEMPRTGNGPVSV